MSINLINAKDGLYAIGAYQALNGLQRFNYRFTAEETNLEELGNSTFVDITTEPQTTGSFEVTDTATLGPLLARMRFDSSTQQYLAGTSSNLTTNVGFSIDHNDLEFLNFDLVEQKRPGSTFSEAKIIPNVTLTRFGVRLTSDGVGSITFDFQGNLLIPVYKPYHKVQAYPCTTASGSTATVPAGWSVTSGTHGILGGMVNNVQLDDSDLTFTASTTITVEATGLAKLGTGQLEATDRISIFLFDLSPVDAVPIDYVNSIKSVKADRINIWLLASGTATSDSNRMLRVQSFDFTADVPREELKEILRNEQRSSTFFQGVRFPLNLSGTMNILEETLHRWAELQGKTLNESATTATVDTQNVLDLSSWVDAKVIVEWYAYGSSSPLQRMTLAKVKITGYEGTLAVGGRKEAVWSFKSDGDLLVEGLAD